MFRHPEHGLIRRSEYQYGCRWPGNRCDSRPGNMGCFINPDFSAALNLRILKQAEYAEFTAAQHGQILSNADIICWLTFYPAPIS